MEFGFSFPMWHLPGWLLAGAVLIALSVYVLRTLERRRAGRIDRFVEAKLASRLLRGYDAAVRRPLFWLTVVGIAALLATFAQPHWGQSWQEVNRVSRDILILLDTSESMRAMDGAVSRLDRARQKINTLLDSAPGDRFGLVAFSGGAELMCPLTLDHGYFNAVLKATDTNSVSLEGTDIAMAIDNAVEVFRAEDESTGGNASGSRAMLLISDGEAVSGDAVEAAEAASKYARVYVIGVGDPVGTEVRTPAWMRGVPRGSSGGAPAQHLSKLDEDMLTRVAFAGDGAYTRATPDLWDINSLMERMDVLAGRDVADDLRFERVNRYQWPLTLAILCFAAEGAWLVLMPFIRRWRLHRAATAGGDAQHA